MSDAATKKAIIKELVEKGRKKGMLTYKEINESLEESRCRAD